MNTEETKDTDEYLELESDYAIIELPIIAIEAEITAKIYLDGEIKTVSRIMDLADLKKAFKEAENGYIPSDTVFKLTEEGKAILDGNGDLIE